MYVLRRDFGVTASEYLTGYKGSRTPQWELENLIAQHEKARKEAERKG